MSVTFNLKQFLAAYLLDKLPLPIDHKTVSIPFDDFLQSIVRGMCSPQQGEQANEELKKMHFPAKQQTNGSCTFVSGSRTSY